MSTNEQLRREWTAANEKVRAAEEQLGAAWAAFADGKAGPPDKELLAEVARLRRECDQKLTAVLDHYGKPSSRDRTERPGS
jgi:hypothetical protein